MFVIILTEILPVIATLGWEQEYFVIDERLFNARPDLVMCGRTVFGHNSAQSAIGRPLFWFHTRKSVCLYARF
jgi:glutamine synthetase type III